MNSEEPVLAYAGTTGHADVDTSREAQEADLLHGITAKAQRYVLIMLSQSGKHGYTVAELREKDGTLHHGRVSSALSNLRLRGKIVMLQERRGNCHVYVLPENQDGRDLHPYRRNRPKMTVDAVAEVITDQFVRSDDRWIYEAAEIIVERYGA